MIAAPGKGDEGRRALCERRAAITAGTQDAERDATGQLEPHVSLFGGDRHGVLAVALVTPRTTGGPVIELRAAIHDGLDPAADARRDADESADRAELGRGPVVIRPSPLALDRADGQEVMDGHPSGRRLPGRFQHPRPRGVSAMLWHVGVAGAEPERTRGPVEERPEHTRRVGAGGAQPIWRHPAEND